MDATVRRIGAIAEQEVGEKCRLGRRHRAAVEMHGEFGSAATVKFLERLLEGDAAFDAELRIRAAQSLFRCANEYRKTRDSLLPLLDGKIDADWADRSRRLCELLEIRIASRISAPTRSIATIVNSTVVIVFSF